MKKYYIAYGSNLNVEQMRYRCPDAKVVGTAEINGRATRPPLGSRLSPRSVLLPLAEVPTGHPHPRVEMLGFPLTGAGTLCHFVTSPCTAGSHRKVIPPRNLSHTGQENRLI